MFKKKKSKDEKRLDGTFEAEQCIVLMVLRLHTQADAYR